MTNFEEIFAEKIKSVLGTKDPAHDLTHVRRVVTAAKKLAVIESAKIEVVVPAAWLHDLVNLSKDHPQRKLGSKMAADEAVLFLKNVHYPEKYLDGIHHAICAHSFSSGISPETIEAKIVQDADRLDALGAIGLARLFSISTQMHRPFYDENDPFAERRDPDDKKFGIDHIYIKLKKISMTMNTKSAQIEAERRFNYINDYIQELKTEI